MSIADQYRTSGRLLGRCLCGAVEIVIDGEHVAAVGACHCGMCREWSGMVYAGFDAAAEAVTVRGQVSEYRSSDFATRAFCPTCGSHLWFRNDGAEAPYELAPGIFPAAAGFPLISEIYIDVAPGYARLAGTHRTATRAEYEARNPFVEGDTP